MFSYRICVSVHNLHKFALLETDSRTKLTRRVNRDPLLYDEAVKMATDYVGLHEEYILEPTPFERFRKEYPRHAYAIDQMSSEARNEWVTSIYKGPLSERDLFFLWGLAEEAERKKRECQSTE